ncbi:helix-turn-helix domain-containing protein [Synechocystis sp. LEGE 06083]|uniref:helix-turn-helix domain-containing protein n=1 Tax=Synechocystis sp. LEGE 06083 TaxID=915336 RepID=UPI0018815B98|nr:helix-turn-helix domain-containing protein [Synechocystis sp. LEGE 06083]MBE9195125.1 helix-turn-helix domain-containing protein [Synechocystis sp. LEGE 06083]
MAELPNNLALNSAKYYLFKDIDELAFFLPEDVRLTPLEREPFKCESVALNLGAVQFNFNYVNRNLHAFGDKQTDFLTFAMILKGKGQQGIENRRLVTEDYLFGFDPERKADLVFPGGCLYCAVYIRPDVFEACTQTLDRPDLDASFLAENYVYMPESLSCLRAYLEQLYELLIQRSPLLLKPGFQRIVLEDFLLLFVTSLPAQRSHKIAGTFFRRSHLVKQADEYMRSYLDQPLTLTDLCEALDASSRALCYGFQELFGRSPMAYLKILRLQGVYRALKVANPNQETVTEIATLFGFYHLGYFARDYKQMFGELPSVTLKRGKYPSSINLGR